MSAAFPLILTFSPGEKEQQLSIFFSAIIDRAADRLQFARTLGAYSFSPSGEKVRMRGPNHPRHSNAKTLRAFPLLPGGEDRDEGERPSIFGFMGRGKC